MKRARIAAIGFGLCLLPCACKHDEPTPEGVSTSSNSATEATLEAHFDKARARARTPFQEKPDLSDCTDFLKEKADTDLCHTAATALTAVVQLDPAAAPEVALPLLSDLSLALVRLAERAHSVDIEEQGHEADAGAVAQIAAPVHSAAAPKASAAAAPKASAAAPKASAEPPTQAHAAVHLARYAARLERDTLKYFAAYLDYAPLPGRQSAANTAKAMQSAHPRWPALNRVLREASRLEIDDGQKQKLEQLMNQGLAHGKHRN